MDPRQLRLHLLAELEVERTERLVEQQHGRTLGQGAGQRDALLLAAGHLGRHPPVEAAEPDEVEVLAGPTAISAVGSFSMRNPNATFWATVMWGNRA